METRSADSSLCWGIVCLCIDSTSPTYIFYIDFFLSSAAAKSQHTRAHSVLGEFYAEAPIQIHMHFIIDFEPIAAQFRVCNFLTR